MDASRLRRLKGFLQSDPSALSDEFLELKVSDIHVEAQHGARDEIGLSDIGVSDEKNLNTVRKPTIVTIHPINQIGADPQQRNALHLPSDTEDFEARCAQELHPIPNHDDLGPSPDRSMINTLSEQKQSLCSNLGLRRGQVAPADLAFCPVLALAKFPYMHLKKRHSERVANVFFDSGKFWMRNWELFYVWPLDNSKVLVLVSEEQFTQLLQEIDDTFQDLDLIFEKDRYWDVGLITQFEQHPRLRPRYLGVSKSRKDYDNMASSAPDPTFTIDGEQKSAAPEDRSLEAFRRTFEECMEQHKQKSRRAKATRKAERIAHQQFIGKQLKRSQRYLGLRPKFSPAGESEASANTPILNDQQLPAIDVEKPVPYPFEKQPIFIAFDVEAYEFNHNIITEIGITTLDTQDLVDIPPGKDGSGWFAKARHRHFRIEENKHIVNSHNVQGCPDRFEFGESEFVRLADAPALIASCFREPFSRKQTREELEASFAARREMTESSNNQPPKPKSPIVLIGHTPDGDIRFLQKLGFNPLNSPNLVEVLDTAVLHRIYRREQLVVSLGAMLYNFDMVGWNLHNAGNDAAYTLQAFLGIVVRDASQRGDLKLAEEYKGRSQTQLKERLSDAVDLHDAEQQGFEADIEDDGGEPNSARPLAQHPKQGSCQPVAVGEGAGLESSRFANRTGDPLMRDPRTAFRGGRARNVRSFDGRITYGSHRSPPQWTSQQPSWIIDKDGLCVPNPAIYGEAMGVSKRSQQPTWIIGEDGLCIPNPAIYDEVMGISKTSQQVSTSAQDNDTSSIQQQTPMAKENVIVQKENEYVRPAEDSINCDSASQEDDRGIRERSREAKGPVTE